MSALALAILVAQIVFEPDAPAPAAAPASPPETTFEPASPPETTFELGQRLGVDPQWRGGGEQVASLLTRARASVKLTLSEHVAARLGVRARHLVEGERGADTLFARTHGEWEAEPDEAYLDVYAKWADLRFGLQTFSWGATPALAPGDVLGAPDLRDAPGLAVASGKLPILAARALAPLGPVRVEAVFAPFFRPTRAYVLGENTALLQPGTPLDPTSLAVNLDPTARARLQEALQATAWPRDDLLEPEVALRVSGELGPLQLGAVAASTWDRTPRATLSPDFRALLAANASGNSSGAELAALHVLSGLGATPQVQPVTSVFERQTTVAGEATLALGDWTVTLDVGFSPRRTFYAADFTPLDASLTTLALGAQFTPSETLQAFVSAGAYVFGGVPSGTRLFLLEGPDAAATHPPLVVALGGARWRTFGERLELAVAGVVSPRAQWAVVPRAAWRFGDRADVFADALALHGPPDGAIGYFARASSVGAGWEARW